MRAFGKLRVCLLLIRAHSLTHPPAHPPTHQRQQRGYTPLRYAMENNESDEVAEHIAGALIDKYHANIKTVDMVSLFIGWGRGGEVGAEAKTIGCGLCGMDSS